MRERERKRGTKRRLNGHLDEKAYFILKLQLIMRWTLKASQLRKVIFYN